MTSFNIAPFHLHDEEYDGTVQRHNFYAYGWLFIQNEHILLPRSLVSMAAQDFMNMGCLSYTAAVATSTQFFAQNNCKFNRQDILLCIMHEWTLFEW